MAWVLSTVQSISLEKGAPELPGFFVGQSSSSAELTLVFEDVTTAEECANAMKASSTRQWASEGLPDPFECRTRSSTAPPLPVCPASDQRDAGSAVKLLVIELLVALAIVVGIMVLWSYILTPIPVY